MNNNYTPNWSNPNRHSENDSKSYTMWADSFNDSWLSVFDKLEAFPRFSSKRSISRFLTKVEIFKKIINIHWSIIECWVFNWAWLFSWAQLSNIYEPINHTRKIIWFDTFAWFPNVSQKDTNNDKNRKEGDLLWEEFHAFEQSIQKVNLERHLWHVKNIELIKWDFLSTSDLYIKENPHTLISLLYLDFDIYEPTKKALEVFLPRMSKGAIICFDEANCSNFPWETIALLETFNLNIYSLKRFNTDPRISYIVL